MSSRPSTRIVRVIRSGCSSRSTSREARPISACSSLMNGIRISLERDGEGPKEEAKKIRDSASHPPLHEWLASSVGDDSDTGSHARRREGLRGRVGRGGGSSHSGNEGLARARSGG